MNSPMADDHKKFAHALVARDVRRLNALIHRADIDGHRLATIETALQKLQLRVTWAMLVDPISDTAIHDPGFYSDGQAVTTMIDWEEGFATLVHSPNSRDVETNATAEALSAERSPF